MNSYRIIKKEASKSKRCLNMVYAIFTAFIITTIFLLIISKNPLYVYKDMIIGMFGSVLRIQNIVKYATILIITSLGVSICFKMKFYNIGAEGQMLIGGIVASYFALYHSNINNNWLLIIMFLSSMLAGGILSMLTGFLKVKFNASESIVTLLCNYIVLQLMMYLQNVAWKEGNFPKIPAFTNGILPSIGKFNIGFIFAIVICVLVYLFIQKSKKGYEITVIGESVETAKYAGISLFKNTILITFISGAIIGIAGFVQVSGNLKGISVNMTQGIGYTAIIVAWIAKLKPQNIMIVGILFACLMQATSFIEPLYEIPKSSADLIQSIVLFSIIAFDFFNEYKIVRRVKPCLKAS